MAGIFSLRNWVMKQLMKTDKSGIMKIPPKGKVDFGEMLLREQLFKKGINPGMIKNEKQLDNILDTPAVPKSERVKPKKSGKVIEVDFDKGRWNKAGGGSAKESWTDKLVRWGGGPSVLAGELGIEGINQIYHLLNMPGLYNKGGRAGLSYLLAEDTNERIPLAGGGSGKPPINFYVDFSASAGGKDENYLGVPGLTERGYNYGGSFAADTTIPLFGGELSFGGELGIGRNKSNVEYKGEPIDWLSNVGETKLGDQWDVGFKWRKKFAGGSIVKGGKWLIKNLLGTREQLKTMRLSPGQLKQYLDQIDDQIKNIEAGGKIPDEVIQTIRKDPKFKSVWQNQKSADPDLREMEEVLLEYGQKHAEGGRIGYAGGGMGRRAFLKLMAAVGATGAAAKYGLASLLKGGKKQIAKELTQVPIKNIEGMPAWFKPLVNKVIKEGEEMKVTEYDRLITHRTKLPNSKTEVYVNQDLNNGDVWVDIGAEKHGFPDGKFGQPVRLEYKASEVIEPSTTGGGYMTKGGENVYPGMSKGALETTKKGKVTKTKEEFWVEEAEFTGGHPENVKFEESTFEKFGNHASNFDEVEMFATGKVKKSKPTKKAQQLEWEQGKAEADADRWADEAMDIDDVEMASGGRVPLSGGGILKLLKLFKKTPKKLETLKDFIDRRQFIKNMVGNTPENEKARVLADLKKATDEARKKHHFKGYEWPSEKEIDTRFQEILAKHSTKHAEGGVAGMLGE